MGGGVCQVSTTIFRALYNAGLLVLEFHAHSKSYVSYYGNTAIEATIYDSHPDVRFINNSKHPIYLEVKRVGNTVMVFVYGKGLPNTTMNWDYHYEKNGRVYNGWTRKNWNIDGSLLNKDSFKTNQEITGH